MTTDAATLGPLILILIATGAVAGVLAGLLGVGGGIVLVPAFLYLFSALGYASDDLMQICVATSLATIIVTSCRSLLAHNKRGAVDWSILRSWAVFIAIGALAGVLVVHHLSTTILQAFFAVMVFVIAMYMLFGKPTWRLAETMPGLARRAIYAPLTGLVSVLLGIGGGSIGTPLMTLHGVPIHRAVATASGFGVIIAVPSAIGFLLTSVSNPPPYTIGAVNIPAFLIVIATTTLTAPIGATLAHKLDPKVLKRVFALFLALVALNMARKVFF
ncbi:sulfite exporter TauE/SafE family protein [Thioclava sp. GXIMD4216]|uniref:sulfite exporter TauE/SafE family protein n=1 Tax=Thioclava sp. GXIMD4216 TaxID=3131929 RepID=UPI0030D2CA8A